MTFSIRIRTSEDVRASIKDKVWFYILVHNIPSAVTQPAFHPEWPSNCSKANWSEKKTARPAEKNKSKHRIRGFIELFVIFFKGRIPRQKTLQNVTKELDASVRLCCLQTRHNFFNQCSFQRPKMKTQRTHYSGLEMNASSYK